MKRITDYFKHPIRQGLISSGLLAVIIMVIGGLGFWWIDPRVDSFSDGLWLAFTTAATVGYGDHVPSTHASRVFAVIVVVLGLAVLSLVTASIAALFVHGEDRKLEHEMLQSIRKTQQHIAELDRKLNRLEQRLTVDPSVPAPPPHTHHPSETP